MQRLPVIGQAFANSAYEAVQRAALEAGGLPIGIERWTKRPHQVADAVAQLRGPDFVGALVAAPHKEKAAALVDVLSDDARTTGAVNVIARDGDRLRGHNTDVDGVRAGLTTLLPGPPGAWPKNAVVLGAGGGARAMVAVLIGSGLQHVAVFNRHLHRAEALVAHFQRSARGMELRARPWHETFMEVELARAGLVVNTSGVGDAGGSPIPAELLPEGIALLDLVLNQAETPLMADVRARGGTAANGQGPFLASSAATFRLLTGTDAPAEVMRAALASELGLPTEGVAVVGD